jgi:hypothetical protein
MIHQYSSTDTSPSLLLNWRQVRKLHFEREARANWILYFKNCEIILKICIFGMFKLKALNETACQIDALIGSFIILMRRCNSCTNA